MPVPNTFANATAAIPLSQLDNNFATAITIGNTAVQLGNTITTINNATLANVTISSVASAVSVAQGGTGSTTLTANNVLIGNGTGAVTFVAPGTSGNVLTSNGTAWASTAAAASAGIVQGGFKQSSSAAFWLYSGFNLVGGSSTYTPSSARIVYYPFVCGQSTTWTKIGIQVQTAQAAKVARLGIYSWSNGVPVTKLLDAGTVSLAATGQVEATISYTMAAGCYGLAIICDSSTAVVRAGTFENAMTTFQLPNGDLDGTGIVTAFYETGSGTTLPTTATIGNTTQLYVAPPLLYLRY